MKADHALSFIEDPWLKITPPIEFNDPYELTGRANKKLNTRLVRMILEDRGARIAVANVLNKRFQLRLKHADIASIARKQPWLWRRLMRWYLWFKGTEFAHDFLRIASACHGVACFTGDPRNRLMWADYADRFKGVVIGFDSRNGFFRKVPLRKVVYSKHRVILPNIFQRRGRRPRRPKAVHRRYLDVLSGLDRLLLTKNVLLRHEREWRICLLLATCRKRRRGMFFRRVPRSCIREVIMGPRCDARLERDVVLSAKESLPQVKIKKLSLHPTSYGFLVNEIPQMS